MELIAINDNKLKIIMDKSDMTKYGLDENEFHCSIINARDILRKILHNSPIETGFENLSYNDKILIQLYPEKNGGCELYVTKITLDEKEDDPFMPQESEERYLLPKTTSKKHILKIPLVSYRFECLEDAIWVSKEMIKRNYDGASSFYRDFDGKYYIFINTPKNEATENRTGIDFLSEFGELMNAENTRMQLCERGKCIFKENAVKQLAEI